MNLNLPNETQIELHRSNADRKHAFRTCVLATVAQGVPVMRYVVKRKSLELFEQIIYTDSRSLKVAHLQENPECGLLFYDAKKQFQVSMQGRISLLSNQSEWHAKATAFVNSQPSVKLDFSTAQAPGSILKTENPEYSENLYLQVLCFTPNQLDLLQLGQPHIRQRATLLGGDWQLETVVP